MKRYIREERKRDKINISIAFLVIHDKKTKRWKLALLNNLTILMKVFLSWQNFCLTLEKLVLLINEGRSSL